METNVYVSRVKKFNTFYKLFEMWLKSNTEIIFYTEMSSTKYILLHNDDIRIDAAISDK